MSEKLPKLLRSKEEQEFVETVGGGSKTLITIVLVITLIAWIALKGIMAKLYAMLCTFQLINELSILSISLPANVSNVQKSSVDLINFNPIPQDLFSDWMSREDSEFPESEQLDYRKAQRMLDAVVDDKQDELQTAEDFFEGSKPFEDS